MFNTSFYLITLTKNGICSKYISIRIRRVADSKFTLDWPRAECIQV